MAAPARTAAEGGIRDMGYRAQRKHTRDNAMLMKNIDYLIAVCKTAGYDASLAVHKLNQMDGDIGLVMENQCAISAALESIIARQDKLMKRFKQFENAFIKMVGLMLIVSTAVLVTAVVISL